MLISLDWLGEWVGPVGPTTALAERLTMAGLEVEEVAQAGPPLEGVVVARVVDVRRHPNAERLSLCTVDDGGERREVVCGAPNVAPGLLVPYARVGSRLPGGREIGAAEIRGITSAGMLCSAKELELSDDGAGLLVLDDGAPIGEPLARYLGLDDTVFDINITPNRGDCFSVLGIAREVAALLDLPPPGARRGEGAAGGDRPVGSLDARFPVTLSAGPACSRFAGRVVHLERRVARSPMWLRERLRRAGVRAIHPVVDVTNYVMLELGQPLHAYDLTKLDRAIDVRFARAGEKLVLLDGREVDLDPDMLVIADGSGPVGLAGIMGGESTAVEPETSQIFLESAFFAPSTIAGRARRLGLHTEASQRFERGVDPEGQARAIERATELLAEICGVRAGPLVVTERTEDVPRRSPVPLRRQRLTALLGLPLDDGEVEQALRRLQMGVTPQDDGWLVVPPAFRFDIAIEEDLVEEVGRVVGYDRIPQTPARVEEAPASAGESRVLLDRQIDLLVARGYHEIITYGFVDPELDALVTPGAPQVEVANPISADLAVMRQSLWPGLLLAARQNLHRQQTRLKLLETGTEFSLRGGEVHERQAIAGVAVGERRAEHWDEAAQEVDFYDVKGDVEALLALTGRAEEFRFEPAEHPALAPGRTARVSAGGLTVGWIGVLHPQIEKRLELRRPAVLFTLDLDAASAARKPASKPYSRFPFVRRDLAVVVDEQVPAERLVEVAREAGGSLVQRVVVFDVYRGPGVDSGRKSIALGLILQDTYRTLTDADADDTVRSVTQRLARELGARIRT
ncbi:MAG TPA: phenylalanine--tRNA ligase subunit beta [Gammaproteobacteria bacterium]